MTIRALPSRPGLGYDLTDDSRFRGGGARHADCPGRRGSLPYGYVRCGEAVRHQLAGGGVGWPYDGPAATMRTPVHHYMRKGELVRSCIAAAARTDRGPAYRACSTEGHLQPIVPGGQVPHTCLRPA